MATLTIKHFDALTYVKKAKELGASEELAELQARQIEQAIDIAVATIKDDIALNELVTKNDLEKVKLELQKEIEMVRKEIAQSSNKIIFWVVGFILASGLLQHFFK